MPIGRVNPATFEWIIPSFQDYFQRPGDFIESPDFDLPDSSWYLQLGLLSNGRMIVCLKRRDYGAPKFIQHTIKINLRTHVKETNIIKHFGRIMLCHLEGLFFYKDEVSSNLNLLITCYIKYHTPHPLAGKDILSCAVQTEVADSVIEKESPKNEDWSSLDMKDYALLRERMKQLLTKGSDHDVTICVQDKEFRAHRNILSARSPVFAMMLSHDTKENNTGTISIEDCDPESFDEFLLYVYSGRAENLTPSNALQLYYPADKYDFPVLKERCVSLLKTSFSVESICDVVLLAAMHREKELLYAATEFFARNIKKILITVGWQKFMPQNPVEANELIIKSMEILHPGN